MPDESDMSLTIDRLYRLKYDLQHAETELDRALGSIFTIIRDPMVHPAARAHANTIAPLVDKISNSVSNMKHDTERVLRGANDYAKRRRGW